MLDDGIVWLNQILFFINIMKFFIILTHIFQFPINTSLNLPLNYWFSYLNLVLPFQYDTTNLSIYSSFINDVIISIIDKLKINIDKNKKYIYENLAQIS